MIETKSRSESLNQTILKYSNKLNTLLVLSKYILNEDKLEEMTTNDIIIANGNHNDASTSSTSIANVFLGVNYDSASNTRVVNDYYRRFVENVITDKDCESLAFLRAIHDRSSSVSRVNEGRNERDASNVAREENDARSAGHDDDSPESILAIMEELYNTRSICPICYGDVAGSSMVFSSECSHYVCEDCVINNETLLNNERNDYNTEARGCMICRVPIVFFVRLRKNGERFAMKIYTTSQEMIAESNVIVE